MDKYLKINKDFGKEITAVHATAVVSSLMVKDLHYNVVGPSFGPDHAFFGEMYEFFSEMADDAAERVRQFGSLIVTSLDRLGALSPVSISMEPITDSKACYTYLRDQLVIFVQMMRELLEMVTDSNDYATNNWLSDCLQSLEKYLWKIAATLGDTEVTEPVELESTESNVIEYIEVGV